MESKISREKLIIVMARYIKNLANSIKPEKPIIKANIEHHNFVSGLTRKWVRTDIDVDNITYTFTDKEITDEEFVTLVSTALRESNSKGYIQTKEWEERNPNGWMYAPIKRVSFDYLILLGKPCKEFIKLNRLLNKYAHKELTETEVNTSDVCGKRNDWSVNISTTKYLCYNPNVCNNAIEFIRNKRTSKDTLSIEMQKKLYHNDDEEYQIAQHLETEWYGTQSNILLLKVTTPTGKEKGKLIIKC